MVFFGRGVNVGGAGRSTLSASALPARLRNTPRLCAIALTTAALGACAQNPPASDKMALRSSARQASLATVHTTTQLPFATDKHVERPRLASYGVASFYTEDTLTANGEKYNPNELTAAHRTLPFGTRLQVTNVTNGRSVTVRVNDRGPFVAGRIVDVSYSAAERLGITERGVAKVKIDIVK